MGRIQEIESDRFRVSNKTDLYRKSNRMDPSWKSSTQMDFSRKSNRMRPGNRISGVKTADRRGVLA